MRYFRVKNFERFQHYKTNRDDTAPVWIKVHRSLLTDFDFLALPDESKAHLMMIWILASQTKNRMPYDAKAIAQRIGANTKVDLDTLVHAGFLILESESESTLESFSDSTATKTHECGSSYSSSSVLSGSENKNPRSARLPETAWPGGFQLDSEMVKFAHEMDVDPAVEFAAWRDDCAAHDRRYRDWSAAWRTRCRNARKFAGSAARASPTNGNALSPGMANLRRRYDEAIREQGGSNQDSGDGQGQLVPATGGRPNGGRMGGHLG